MPAVSQAALARGIRQGEADPDVVRQLMFNRILASLRLLWVEHVTVTKFDAETGTIEANLAGVNFVVNVSLEETRAKARSVRGGPPAAPNAFRDDSGTRPRRGLRR